jgi:hypothetical protein
MSGELRLRLNLNTGPGDETLDLHAVHQHGAPGALSELASRARCLTPATFHAICPTVEHIATEFVSDHRGEE